MIDDEWCDREIDRELRAVCSASEDETVKKVEADLYPGFAPPRRRRKSRLLTTMLLAVGLTVCVLFLGPVLLAMALLKAIGDAVESFGESFGFYVGLYLLAVAMPTVLELLVLLQTGGVIRFAFRVLQLLSN